LADLNCKQGRGVVEVGAMDANSYHELACRITNYVMESWKSCCKIASDSQNGFRYSYPASASSLFKQTSFESVPQPQGLYAYVEDEYRRAKIELGEDANPEYQQVRDTRNVIEIVETIDSGLYGKVYKGVQSPLNRDVAVKIIKDCGKRTADVIAHARLLTRVQHPALVTVFSVQNVYIPEFDKALPAIVMEWLDGLTFGRRLAEARFTTGDAILLCRDVVDGIAELHRSGLCHGDLHFGNVIVLSNGHAKIIDIDANKEASLARMSLHSREGAMSSDVDYCRGIMFKTLRHSSVSLSKLSEIEIRLQAADSLKDLKDCIEMIDIGDRSSAIDLLTNASDSLTVWLDDNVHSSKLSESLPRMLRYAINSRIYNLERWVRLELYGYNEHGGMKESDVVPKYRAVAGRWLDKFGLIVDLSHYPDLAEVNEYRFRSEVALLEELAARTEMQNIADDYMTSLFRQHMGIEVVRFCFNPIAVRGTLDVIRNLLAEKYHAARAKSF